MLDQIAKGLYLSYKADRIQKRQNEIADEIGNLMGVKLTREQLIHRTNLDNQLIHMQDKVRKILGELKEVQRQLDDN